MKEQVKQMALVKNLIQQVYQTASVGGCAHIVLDDHNVANHHIEWCLGYCSGYEHAQRFPDDDRGDVAKQIECLRELQKLPYRLRLKLVKDKWNP